MRDESDVWQALLKRKGLSVTDLAGHLGVTRQHAHRLLTGRRPAESQRGELDLVPAGDAQPLFASRDVATDVARALEPASLHVCVVPVWPGYAWRNLVGFHAAWGAQPEPRKLFIVDNGETEIPIAAIVEEIRSGLDATLRSRAQARDPAYLSEVELRLQRLN